MAANLTPQYLEAESEYKKAKSPEERLECLRKMYQLLPKHKASEKEAVWTEHLKRDYLFGSSEAPP